MKSIFINNNVTANASSGSLFAQEMRKNLSCSLSGALATAEIKHNPASTGYNDLIGIMAKVVPAIASGGTVAILRARLFQ